MEVKTVWTFYFSATGTTAAITARIADVLAKELGAVRSSCDFTLPQAREDQPDFQAADVVICGTPVYAGRVPNVLLPYLKERKGNGATGVPVVLFGNRDFDDALIELRDLMADAGFHIAGAAAFVGEHSFSEILGAGRPDAEDLAIAENFARQLAQRIQAAEAAEALPEPEIPGVEKPYRGYYQPRDRAGHFIDIRKVRPKVSDACNQCGWCVAHCSMEAIVKEDVTAYQNICIKCCACIKGCAAKARYFDDPGFLYHKEELEEGLTRRAEPQTYL